MLSKNKNLVASCAKHQENRWLETHVIQWQKFDKIVTCDILKADHMPVKCVGLWEEIRK